MMKDALYGRMKIGRCLSRRSIGSDHNDPMLLGCYVDVLKMFDEKCSGRGRCQMTITELRKEKPCYEDLKSYLEADYECLSG